MPNALIKFTGSTTGAGGDGEALIGIVGETVTLQNVDNTDVDKAQFELLYVPPTSALTVGVKQVYSTDLDWTFVPDVSECFVVRLRVKDASGNEAVDDRVFGVLETTGRLIPPFRGTAKSTNFGGQEEGWQPYLRAYLKEIDDISALGATILRAGGGGYASVTAAEVRNLGTANGQTTSKEAQLATNDASAHTILTFPIPTDTGLLVDVEIIGIEDSAASMHWYKKSRAFLNNAGVFTDGAQKDVDDEEVSGPPAGTWAVTISRSSGNAIVQVNSDGDSVRWYVLSGVPQILAA